MSIAKSVLLFAFAAIAEIGGAWLVWQAVREGKAWWLAGLGVIALGIYGSPTITENGTDIFPDGTPTSDLACRIYKTPSGFSGTPTIDQLIEALKRRGL